MKKSAILIISFSLYVSFCHAVTNYYVVPPPNAGIQSPYTNWAMAATNIQAVINIALSGDTIYITNGHYYLTNQITVDRGVIIRSFNNGITDPTNTIIDGNNYTGKAVTNRCMYITSAAIVDGLMLTNGNVSLSDGDGGGCYMTYGILTNCIITGNSATNKSNGLAGGIYALGSSIIIANCRVIGNRSNSDWGTGIYDQGCIVKNCVIGWNSKGSGPGPGIGISGGSIFNCDIVSNTGYGISFVGNNIVVSNCTIRNTSGIGINVGSYDCLVTHSSIIGNTNSGYGAGVIMSKRLKMRNCLIAWNVSGAYGGGLYWDTSGQTGYVESCTIVSNNAKYGGGGIYYNFANNVCPFTNTIVCSNTTSAGNASDMYVQGGGTPMITNYFYNSCCKTISLPPAQGNIQSDPLFVDFPNGNFRLSQDSPCINRGANANWMTGMLDLDGRSRIDRYSGIVDMGCYEYLNSGMLIMVPGLGP
jgi:hypothetical protein